MANRRKVQDAIERARRLSGAGGDVRADDVKLILVWLDSREIEIERLRDQAKETIRKARSEGWREGYDDGFQEGGG